MNKKAARCEIRFPDAAGNPYLGFAAMLMAGLDGIKNKIDPGKSFDDDLYSLSEDQVKKYQDYKDKEQKTLEEARTIALQLRLKMKISDIEFQGDGKKVTFYYTSEGRVDFRELIRRYASSFKSRIQMLQVSYREEASRLGGIGSCGRELCCSTWLTDYKVVSMGAAKTQNLSINMLKLSGQCGRLKCCLNYELETYHEAFNQFPNDKVLLKTESGVASLRKIDILKGTAWYCYEKSFDWIPVDVKRVNEIIALNKEGKTPITLSDTALGAEIAFKTLEFKDDLLGDTDLTRMDDKNKKSRGKGGNSRNNKSGNRNSNSRNNSPRNDRPKRDDTKKLSGNKPNDGSRSKPTNKKPNPNRKPKSEGNPPESKSGTSNKPDNKE